MVRRIISLALVGVLFLALAAPASAGGFRGGHGGFHGGFRGGFHHRCCFGPGFVGGVFLGATLASPWWWG